MKVGFIGLGNVGGKLCGSLLRNGFRLLRPGGRLVYSTCSFSLRQNEEVVQWLLDSEAEARLVPAALPASAPVRHPSQPALQLAVKVRLT